MAILCALFDLASAQWFYFSPDLADLPWLEAHRTEALVQLLLKYFYATVTLITCYAMMQAKDWARWTYLIIATIHFGIAFVLLGLPDAKQNYRFFAFHGAMLPGILLFFLALFVLFTRDAREYFHGGGRPWWKIEEEADEREARRSRRK